MRYEPFEAGFDAKDPEAFKSYVVNEFRNLAAVLTEVEEILLKELHVEPPRPRNGQVVLADGTDWDPGTGAGFYGRSAGAWVKLG